MGSNDAEIAPRRRAECGYCYICGASAIALCERCHQPICRVHECSLPHMSWHTFSSNQGSDGVTARGATTWQRYLPDGKEWHVCPACAHAITAVDAREQAHDRWDLWVMRLLFVGIVLAFIASCWLLNYLGSH